MRLHTRLAAAFVMVVAVGMALAQPAGSAQPPQPAPRANPSKEAAARPEGLKALEGEWIYVEDRTEGRTLEQLGPPMASTFSMRVEEGGGAVILNGHGSGHKNVRVAIDGSETEVTDGSGVARYSGSWKDGTFKYQVGFERGPEKTPGGLIRRSFRITDEGLVVRVTPKASSTDDWVGLYRQAKDIALPAPAKAKIGDLEWLTGAWVGKRSSGSSVEERWSPPLGGAMLAISRTVNTSGKMNAFEYLRIVERDGGPVYIAQPGGAKGTEFVLTEIGDKRAVFDNPRHDYPKRIVYEITAEGGLTATTGFMKGGTPRKFEFQREGK